MAIFKGSPSINPVGAGLGLAQGIADTIVQVNQARKQREHEKGMADYAHRKNVEMWNMQNRYNSPQAQMDRLQAAGLNPNMVYGQGTVAGNTSSQLPKYQAPRQDFSVRVPNVAGMLQQYSNLNVQQAQADNLRATAEGTRDQLITNALNRSLMGIQLRKGQMDIGQAPLTGPYGEQLSLGITGKRLSNREAMQRVKNLTQNYEQGKLTMAQTRAQTKLIQANTGLSRRQAKKLGYEMRLIQQNIARIGQEMKGQALSQEYQKWYNQAVKDGTPLPTDDYWSRIVWKMAQENGIDNTDAQAMAGLAERVLNIVGTIATMRLGKK